MTNAGRTRLVSPFAAQCHPMRFQSLGSLVPAVEGPTYRATFTATNVRRPANDRNLIRSSPGCGTTAPERLTAAPPSIWRGFGNRWQLDQTAAHFTAGIRKGLCKYIVASVDHTGCGPFCARRSWSGSRHWPDQPSGQGRRLTMVGPESSIPIDGANGDLAAQSNRALSTGSTQ